MSNLKAQWGSPPKSKVEEGERQTLPNKAVVTSADGFSTKVASPVLKAKKINLKAQWGDPPKPNLWKVQSKHFPDILDGRNFSYCNVQSPILIEDASFQLMLDEDSEHWAVSYTKGRRSFLVWTLYNAKTFAKARELFLSPKGWERVKIFAKMTGENFFRGKVASSNLKAEWGNPPKPNLWKIKEHKDQPYGDYTEVTSPLLDGGELLLTSPEYNGSHHFQIEYADKNDQVSVIEVLGSYPYHNALRWFLSSGGWSQIIGWASKQPISIFRTYKVASSNLKAQWGNPPKPSLWKVKEYPNFAGGAFVEVTSPLLGGHHRSLLLTSPEYNNTHYYQIEYTNGNDPEWYNGGYNGVVGVILHVNSYTKALEYFLSKNGWDNIIKRWASKQEFPIFGKNKVASSNLKAQWGNPPKPNLWKVEDYKKFVEVTSPLLGEGLLLLTNPTFNGTPHYQINWKPTPTTKPLVIMDAVMPSVWLSREDALDFFLSPHAWAKIIQWANKQPMPIFTVDKVASEE